MAESVDPAGDDTGPDLGLVAPEPPAGSSTVDRCQAGLPGGGLQGGVPRCVPLEPRRVAALRHEAQLGEPLCLHAGGGLEFGGVGCSSPFLAPWRCRLPSLIYLSLSLSSSLPLIREAVVPLPRIALPFLSPQPFSLTFPPGLTRQPTVDNRPVRVQAKGTGRLPRSVDM